MASSFGPHFSNSRLVRADMLLPLPGRDVNDSTRFSFSLSSLCRFRNADQQYRRPVEEQFLPDHGLFSAGIDDRDIGPTFARRIAMPWPAPLARASFPRTLRLVVLKLRAPSTLRSIVASPADLRLCVSPFPVLLDKRLLAQTGAGGFHLGAVTVRRRLSARGFNQRKPPVIVLGRGQNISLKGC